MKATGEQRWYPRIRSGWSLYQERSHRRRKIGSVTNISLSGLCLQFAKQPGLDPGKNRFALGLKNSRLQPAEVIISGWKRWNLLQEDTVSIGISWGRLGRKERFTFVHFLSRGGTRETEATLL